jgi:KDO2-lipid IV(A) lauroyltransferase
MSYHIPNRPARWHHYLEYGALRGITAFFRLIGIEKSSAIGGWLGRTIGPLTGADKTAHNNLQLCMPELTEDAIASITGEMWDNFGRTFGEFAFIKEMADYGPGCRIEIEGEEHVDNALETGKSIIFVSGHFANWEMISPYIRSKTKTLYGVYRAANNPLVDRWTFDQRKLVNFDEQLPKGRLGAKLIIEAIRQNISLAMLVDQKMNDGLEAPFFGRPSMTPSASAQLALKYGCTLVPVHIVRRPRAQFVLKFYPPLTISKSGKKSQDILELTTAYNAFLEDRIREVPGQWFWMHKRWAKPQRKKKYLKKT